MGGRTETVIMLLAGGILLAATPTWMGVALFLTMCGVAAYALQPIPNDPRKDQP